MPPTVIRPEVLDADTRVAVRAIVQRFAAEGGSDPLSDQARTQLKSSSVEHAVAVEGGRWAVAEPHAGRPFHLSLRLPPLGAVYLKPSPTGPAPPG